MTGAELLEVAFQGWIIGLVSGVGVGIVKNFLHGLFS